MELYLDHAPCLYFAIRDDGTVAAVNDTFCAKLGYTKEELVSQKSDRFFTVATRIFQQTHFLPLLKMQGYAEEIYMTLQAKDGGHLPVLINAERKEITGEACTKYAGIIVRNRKKFEDELVAAKKEAEAALHENTALQQVKKSLQEYAEQLDQQMTKVTRQHGELRQFNRVVTHDLQEPLRKLLIFSGMIQNTTSAEASGQIMEKVKKVCGQMYGVLSDLQQYVWLTEASMHISPVDIEDLLPEILQQLKTESPGVAIVVTKETLPRIEGDREQVRFLFHQVLANAVRFRKPGNTVHLQIRCDRLLLNKFRQVSGKYQYQPFLKLQIQDNGIGFDPAYKGQVFDLFRRLHPQSGRGVGLSLCKKIVENHQGTITIESKTDAGTTVSITLPEHQMEPAAGETHTSPQV